MYANKVHIYSPLLVDRSLMNINWQIYQNYFMCTHWVECLCGMKLEALTWAGGKFQHNCSPERESRLDLEALPGFHPYQPFLLGLCQPLPWPPPLDVKRLPLVAPGAHSWILQIFQCQAFPWPKTTRAYFGRDLNTRVNIVRKQQLHPDSAIPHSKANTQASANTGINLLSNILPSLYSSEPYSALCSSVYSQHTAVRVAQNVLWNISSHTFFSRVLRLIHSTIKHLQSIAIAVCRQGVRAGVFSLEMISCANWVQSCCL